ncbi:MAG: hypothetical protein J5J06_15745 [Phycisphaerae bacterium]|nr:hypothetical protein [Phycisphaerae bacterium]
MVNKNGQSVTSSLLLGTGGSSPGLMMLCHAGKDSTRLLSLPAGHSIYAIDVDERGGVVAAGSRHGTIDILRETAQQARADRLERLSLVQGAPVLSVCLLDGGLLASSDMAGRCLLWPPGHSSFDRPRCLERREGKVCSLLALPDHRLLGLSSSGKVLLLRLPSGELADNVDAPVPPVTLGLVQLQHWPVCNSAVYASADGELVLVDLGDLRISVCPAHGGNFSVAITEDGRLCTIGREDGLLRTWTWSSNSAGHGTVTRVAEAKGPCGVVSAAVVPDTGPLKLLLIHEDGTAAIWATGTERLQPDCRLPGNHYRTVVGPPALVRHLARREREVSEARALCYRIQQGIHSRRFEGLEESYHKLEKRGFEAVISGLRAHEAAAKNDSLGELKARHRLIQLLPAGDPRSTRSILRYAEILEQIGLYAEAHSACLRNLQRAPDDSETFERLARIAKLLKENRCVIATSAPTEERLAFGIQAAAVLDMKFQGLWLLERSKPVPCPEAALTAEKIAAKFEEIRAEDGRMGLSPARVQALWWITDGRVRETETVVFGGDSRSRLPRLCSTIEAFHDGLQNVLVRSVLFDAGTGDPGHTPAEHNRTLLEAFDGLYRHETSNSWLRGLNRVINHTLQRLRTEALALRPI